MPNEMMPPAKEIGEILETVTSKVPMLITGLMDTLYSPEAGKKMGQSVGAMYKELLEAGIPETDALSMAKEYMISIKSIMSAANNPTVNNFN